MRKNNSFVQYHVEDYFYLVEFQQRGSAHIHCLLWLVTEDGYVPPKIYLVESPNEDMRVTQHSKFVEYFDSIISASLTHDGVNRLGHRIPETQSHIFLL